MPFATPPAAIRRPSTYPTSPARTGCAFAGRAAFLASAIALGAFAPTLAGALPPQLPGRNLTLEAHRNEFPSAGTGYASCWGYVHGDGREYAIIGHTQGTSIYNVTDPANTYRVATIDGPSSLWREMKSYRNWIYIVTEGGFGQTPDPRRGLQIVRMTDPENPVYVGEYRTTFTSAHTVSVDTTRGILYANGTKDASGQQAGVRILSLANPEAPVEVGAWPGGVSSSAQYVHDSVPIGNRLFASSIYVQTQRILDVTNPALPTQTSEWTYPNAYYPHNAWPDATGNFLYVTDEQNGQTLRVFDITTPTAPALVNEWTSNPQAIVHNAHVNGNELWLANYTEGVRVLDITDPTHPAEFGWADTYPGTSGGFSGVWGVYPYFPSGTVIASDMNTGLYVFTPQRDYGLVRVEVRENGLPLAGATVYVTTHGDSLDTGPDGIVQFAPGSGSHAVAVEKFGYASQDAFVLVTAGGQQTLVFDLTPKPTADLSGIVRDQITGVPLEGAEVNLRWTPVHEHTPATGEYTLNDVPDDAYRLEARRPGYIPMAVIRQIGPGFGGTQNVSLKPAATWDRSMNAVVSGIGWTVANSPTPPATSVQGAWTRVEPYGTGVFAPLAPHHTASPAGRDLAAAANGFEKPRAGLFHEGHEAEGATPGQVQPEYDRSPGTDSLCFVTGNQPNQDPSAIDIADLDNGKTFLTSPPLNMTGMQAPTIGAWVWFYSQFRSPDDWLAIQISGNNGTTWVPVDTLRGVRNHWEEIAIRVADFVTPSTQVKVRFIAADLGVNSVVEAAVDDVTTYDAATAPLGLDDIVVAPVLAFRPPAPNPASGPVSLALSMPVSGTLEVEVLDIAGRRVRTIHRGEARAGVLSLRWDGADDAGRATPAGLYFARARTPQGEARARVVRVR